MHSSSPSLPLLHVVHQSFSSYQFLNLFEMLQLCIVRNFTFPSGSFSLLAFSMYNYLAKKVFPFCAHFGYEIAAFSSAFYIPQVSSGTLDRARNLMKRILELCNTPLEQGSEAMKMVQQRSFHSVTRHLVKEVISSNENVRKQV